jgi:RNA polymerase-associated protein
MAIVTKRTVMSLYSNVDDIYSHQVRIVLAEKGVNVEILPVSIDAPGEELLTYNPYGTIPTLIDRDLVLYEARIILEYLDERFPHPPLLPVYPVARGETRKMMYRIEQDWYSLMYRILKGVQADEARVELKESILSLDRVFSDRPYFLSEEFSLLDCAVAPLLWRLPQLAIEIPKEAKGIKLYMQRVFERESFKVSLTEAEKQIRAA